MSLEVWMARLPEAEAQAARWEPLLSPEELGRSAGMADEEARRRFVVGRGLLRALLAEKLGASPQNLRIVYGEAGKPRLSGAPIAFNVAHSGELIVFAVCSPRESDEGSSAAGDDGGNGSRAADGAADDVGVDLERTGRTRDVDRIVRRFGSERERDEYFALPPALREDAFYRWWTRKEALVKAAGTSLARGLGSVSLPFDEREVHRVTSGSLRRGASGNGRSWLVATVPVEGGYWLSVARPAGRRAAHAPVRRFSPVERESIHRGLPLTLLLRW